MTISPEESGARLQLRQWLGLERQRYADLKFSGPVREAMVEQALADPSIEEWGGFLLSYVRRAQLLGLDTAAGRQALGKAIVTAMHIEETAIQLWGPMPRAGHPSGEIRLSPADAAAEARRRR